jgi:hypothetical protein
MKLSRNRWAALSPGERARTARALAKELPDGFAFDRVRVCRLGGLKNAVAFYTFGGSSFALIPGGAVTVGYDKDRPWEPTEEEAESWQFTKDEYGLRGSIRQRIASVTRRPKRITVPPLLAETVPREVGWEPISADTPEVQQLLREHPDSRTVTCYAGGEILRISRGRGKRVTAERNAAGTHAGLNALLKRDGFRFPGVDEWEHLCGAGADTLFRWGDHAPCDCYPVGSRSAHQNIHRQPNAFGLSIASDPYKMELTSTAGTTRGGDGGNAVCGGVGFFVGWLTLATAYWEGEACRHDREDDIDPEYTVGRRVLELG